MSLLHIIYRVELSLLKNKKISGLSGRASKELLYISTSVWVLPTSNAGEIVIFSVFTAENLKKQEFCNRFFKFAPKRWSTVLFPQKNSFFSQKPTFTY